MLDAVSRRRGSTSAFDARPLSTPFASTRFDVGFRRAPYLDAVRVDDGSTRDAPARRAAFDARPISTPFASTKLEAVVRGADASRAIDAFASIADRRTTASDAFRVGRGSTSALDARPLSTPFVSTMTGRVTRRRSLWPRFTFLRQKREMRSTAGRPGLPLEFRNAPVGPTPDDAAHDEDAG